MKSCWKCRTENPNDASFCSNCGNLLSGGENIIASLANLKSIVAQNKKKIEDIEKEKEIAYQRIKNINKTKKQAIIFSIVLSVLFVVAVIFAVFSYKNGFLKVQLEKIAKENDVIIEQSNNPTGVLINGVQWATCNVDAPGTFAAKPEDAGMFYQWNRKKGWNAIDKKVSRWNSSDQSGTQWSAKNDPSPNGWRVPTVGEIQSLLNTTKVTCEWKNQNGINGRKFTDKTTGESIFLPAAGWRGGGDGVLCAVGENGSYWSSTRTEKNGKPVNGWEPGLRVYNLRFVSDIAHCYDELPSYGFSVRPVAEYVVTSNSQQQQQQNNIEPKENEINIGTWRLIGTDNNWVAELVVQSVEKNKLKGYFEWYSNGNRYCGREYYEGTYDEKTRDVMLQGTRLENASGIGIGVYKATLSNNGKELTKGTWGGSGVISGTWEATLNIPTNQQQQNIIVDSESQEATQEGRENNLINKFIDFMSPITMVVITSVLFIIYLRLPKEQQKKINKALIAVLFICLAMVTLGAFRGYNNWKNNR